MKDKIIGVLAGYVAHYPQIVHSAAPQRLGRHMTLRDLLIDWHIIRAGLQITPQEAERKADDLLGQLASDIEHALRKDQP